MTRYALTLMAALLLGATVLAADAPPDMTTYYFGILVRGPKWSPQDTPERAKIQEGHMAPAGHISMVAGAGAETALWEPFRAWLGEVAAPG